MSQATCTRVAMTRISARVCLCNLCISSYSFYSFYFLSTCPVAAASMRRVCLRPGPGTMSLRQKAPGCGVHATEDHVSATISSVCTRAILTFALCEGQVESSSLPKGRTHLACPAVPDHMDALRPIDSGRPFSVVVVSIA